jgi:hypothetical protein
MGFCLRVALAVTAVVGLASPSALADVTKQQCIDANGQGQDLRRAGKLSDAREQLRACGNPRCPAIVRDDCTKRLDELESAQPTVLFAAKDGSGHDLGEVTVTEDGHPLAEKLDGTALRVDPGQHEFTFTAKDQPSVSQTFIIREGEKDRRELVQIGAPAPAQVAAPPPPAPSAEEPADGTAPAPGRGLGTRKILGLAVGGAGVVGLVVGSVFGAMTFSETSKQKSDCASPGSCSDHGQALSDHSAAVTDGTISTVAFVAGGLLLGGGAALFFLPSRPSEQPAAAALTVRPSVGPGGGFVSVGGGF